MFNGTIGNTYVANKPLARLTIGVCGSDGKRAAIEFKRDDATTELVAQVPADEIPAELPPPTTDDLDAHYLTKMDWTMNFVEGLGELWSDPIGGGDYTFANALDIQAARDHRDLIAEALSFEDTPLAELYGGE